MKSTTTSFSFALLCFLSGLQNASALLGFSFGNLLFSLNVCKLPGPGCHADCKGPLAPTTFCANNECQSSNDSTTIKWTREACKGFDSSGTTYSKCMTMAVTDCETATDANGDESYVEADASSWVGDTASSNGTPPVASRMSFLPYIIAATASTMFLVLYFWSNKRKEALLRREDLLSDDESFQGPVAERIGRAQASSIPPPSMVEMEGGTTGYAMA